MADFFSQIKPVTAGERLFQHIGKLGMRDLAACRLSQQKFVRLTGRGDVFGLYLEGSLIAFTFKRIMKACHGIFDDKSLDIATCNARLRRMLHEWFDWLSKDDLGLLLRDTIRAEDASNNTIPNDVEKEIWHSRRVHKCCFCGILLIADTDSVVRDKNGTKATLEHVWPQSLGGDSIKDNLVQACDGCNKNKKDLFTWEEGSIHDFIYPTNFQSSRYFSKIPIAQRILVQRRAVLTLAQREKITLKQALLRVGPYSELKSINAEDTWDFFNTQNHSEFLGETLW